MSKTKENTGLKQCRGATRIQADLENVLGAEKVIVAEVVREMYAFDSSPFMHSPDVVVFPTCTRDVSAVLKIARRHRIPVTARGAGTCLSGGAVPVRGGISLVMTRMDAILNIDPVSRTALVEPGVVNMDLQKALDTHGLIFPPDPASRKVATIGGNVAECAGGIQGARYGVTRNYVLGLELILADGTIATTGLLSPTQARGPDLTGIFNGSEGAFAVITGILVHLLPAPESSRTALASFVTLDDAGRAVSNIIRKGIVPTALELMDQTMLRAVDDFTGIGFPVDAEALLLMEVDGFVADLDRELEEMVRLCKKHHAVSVQQAAGREEQEQLWRARRSGNGALGRIRPAYIVHDVTVPRNHVASLLTRIRDIGKKYDIIIAQMAHAGDGNAHPHLLYYPDEKNIQQRLHEATGEIFRVALELGGTISGEHGIGLEKQAFMGMQFSRIDLDFMQQMKSAFDPAEILNPGKIFPRGSARGLLPVLRSSPEKVFPESLPPGAAECILEFIPDNFTMKVKGETPLRVVQEMAATINSTLPLCSHTLGDIPMDVLVGRGARGHQALAAGSLKEFIYGMEFETPCGALISTGGHTAKNVAGFDFTRLLWQSGGRLGKIKTLTLRLMPLPETERLFVQGYSTLKGCIAAAKKIISHHLSLCTLKAVGPSPGDLVNKWRLVAGLMGSTGVVATHSTVLMKLMGTGKDGIVHLDRRAASGFWKQQKSQSRSYPRVLLHGAGLRAPLFRLLSEKGSLFEKYGNIRVEIDFGQPELLVRSEHDASVETFEITSFTNTSCDVPSGATGFFVAPPDMKTHDPVYEIVRQCLWGRGPLDAKGDAGMETPWTA